MKRFTRHLTYLSDDGYSEGDREHIRSLQFLYMRMPIVLRWRTYEYGSYLAWVFVGSHADHLGGINRILKEMKESK